MFSGPVEKWDNLVGDETLMGKRWPFLSPRPETGVGTRSGSRSLAGVVGMRIGWASVGDVFVEDLTGKRSV
jgi:hypothetical protein